MAKIAFHQITKYYQGAKKPAVDAVTFDVPEGSTCMLVGTSGSGKTTLLRMVNRLIEPTSGEIVIDGKNVLSEDPIALRRRIGYVIQQVGLFPHMTIAENVRITAEIAGGWSKQRMRERVDELLLLVGLPPAEYRQRYPRQLSGGQQQRVGLARAIVYRPRILLLDEPLSNLDAGLREELRFEIGEVVRRLEITAVYVTHDQREALALSDRIALMQGGRIVQFDTPEMIHRRPASAFVAGFVGYANRLPIELAGGVGRLANGAAVLRPAESRGLSGPAIAFIHAGDVALRPAEESGENLLPCRVVAAAFMGDHTEYVLEHGPLLRLKAEAKIGAVEFARGADVAALLPAEKLVVVAAEKDAADGPAR